MFWRTKPYTDNNQACWKNITRASVYVASGVLFDIEMSCRILD